MVSSRGWRRERADCLRSMVICKTDPDPHMQTWEMLQHSARPRPLPQRVLLVLRSLSTGSLASMFPRSRSICLSNSVQGGGDEGGHVDTMGGGLVEGGTVEKVVVGHRMRTWYCLMFALLVMGFPRAAECCNYIAAYLKAGLQLSP
jgi:hypothetical protein